MLTAQSVHEANPGSRLFTAGALSIVIKTPSVQEWDLYIDMKQRDPMAARKLLLGSVIFPAKAELGKFFESSPATRGTIENLVVKTVIPETSDGMIASDTYPDAQMMECDGIAFHLRMPTEEEYEAFELTKGRGHVSAAATILVKTCLKAPSLIEFDAANAKHPALKHFLTGNLMTMAGASIEFTEKKS